MKNEMNKFNTGIINNNYYLFKNEIAIIGIVQMTFYFHIFYFVQNKNFNKIPNYVELQ